MSNLIESLKQDAIKLGMSPADCSVGDWSIYSDSDIQFSDDAQAVAIDQCIIVLGTGSRQSIKGKVPRQELGIFTVESWSEHGNICFEYELSVTCSQIPEALSQIAMINTRFHANNLR